MMKHIALMLIILASADIHAVKRQDTISAGAELAIKRDTKIVPTTNIITRDAKEVVNPLTPTDVLEDKPAGAVSAESLDNKSNFPPKFVPTDDSGSTKIDPSQLPPAPNLPPPFVPNDGSPIRNIDPAQLPPAPSNLPPRFVPNDGSPIRNIDPANLPPAPSTSKPKRPLPQTPQRPTQPKGPETPSQEDIQKQAGNLSDAQKRKLNNPDEICVKYLNPEQEAQAQKNLNRKNFLQQIQQGKGLNPAQQQKYEPAKSPMEQELRDKIQNIRRATTGDSTDDDNDSEWED